jgi:hypothetical protein
MISRIDAAGENGWEMAALPTDTGRLHWTGFSATTRTYNHNWDTSGLSIAWHHMVITRESGVESKMYVNNSLVSTDPDVSDTITAGGDLTVGANKSGAENFWLGYVQDLFVHNGTILTGPQVSTIYNVGAAAAENRGGLLFFD